MRDMIDTGLGFNETCPITGTHKYYMTKTLEMYEPIKGFTYEDDEDMTLEQIDAVNEYIVKYPTYRKKEMAFLNCGCGSAILKEIERV